jgi:hypothetical protein
LTIWVSSHVGQWTGSSTTGIVLLASNRLLHFAVLS